MTLFAALVLRHQVHLQIGQVGLAAMFDRHPEWEAQASPKYRALAASIAGDAARMLSAFEELDRLAKLDSGAMELDPGETEAFRPVAQDDRALRCCSTGTTATR